MSPLFLFDIDGVLADDTERLPFALNKDWKEYFKPERVWEDKPLSEGWEELRTAVFRGEVKFLTGRRADLRWVTLAWLNLNWMRETGKSTNFQPQDIYMRPYPDPYPVDSRPRLAEFKEGVYHVLQSDYSEITLYDDDPAVVDHIRQRFGKDAAVHCQWYTKHPDMVKRAVA